MASTKGFEPEPQWRKVSTLTTAPPKEQEEFTNQCSWIASIWRNRTKHQTPVYHRVQQLN